MPQTYMIYPGEGPEPGFIASYDEFGQPLGPQLSQLPGALSNWRISQSTIYDPTDPLRGIRLGPDGTNFLTVSESGAVELILGRSEASINQGTSTQITYGVSGSIEIPTETGTRTLDITFARLAGQGRRWAEAYDEENDRYYNVAVPANLTLRELNAQANVYTRFLSADEVVAQAVASHLISLSHSIDPDKRDEFRDILRGMGISEDAFNQAASGEVAAWVEMNQYNLRAASRYTFSAAG